MALESGTYISSLNAANPVATDGLAESDNHLRLLKSTILATFPNVTGAINATHTEINTATDGSTAATSTTIEDADRVVLNDDGTMVQAAMTDVTTYINATMTLRNDVVTASSIADNSITADKLATGAAFIAGMVMPYAGVTAPTGWELCYGQSVDRAGAYADLFAAIGQAYGSTSSSTFNLPDLRGRVIAGQDDMGGSSANRLTSPINGDTRGAVGGSQSHTLTIAQMPSHTHNITGTYRKDAGSPPGGSFPHGSNSGTNTNITAGGFLNISNSNTGSGAAHNNVQPTIILNYIIKI